MDELFRTAGYLKYILLSRHRKGHGIHSPFAFNFISNVLRNKIPDDVVFRIENVRRKLLSDNRRIIVNDLGAGSKRMKNNVRKISDIARFASVSGKYGKVLYNLAKDYGQSSTIELGTSLGISTMYIAEGNRRSKLFTVEGCSECLKIAKENFDNADLREIRAFNSSFDEKMGDFLQSGLKPGFVFIDGDHRKDSILRYFTAVLKMADENTVIALDDIHHSREMEEAWTEIKAMDRVSVSFDIHRMGIVFFRSDLSDNHYIIRY